MRNVHAHNLCGVVISWAPLDRIGLRHVNNHSPEYVRALFEDLGYAMDAALTEEMRRRAARAWMSGHIFVFRRRRPLSPECEAG